MRSLRTLYNLLYTRVSEKQAIYNLFKEIYHLEVNEEITNEESHRLEKHLLAQKPSKSLHPEFYYLSNRHDGIYIWWTGPKISAEISERFLLRVMEELDREELSIFIKKRRVSRISSLILGTLGCFNFLTLVIFLMGAIDGDTSLFMTIAPYIAVSVITLSIFTARKSSQLDRRYVEQLKLIGNV